MWFSTFGVQGFVLQSRTDGAATISNREFETIRKLVSILEKTDVGFSGPNQPKLIDDENLCYTYTLRVYCRGFLWERERLPCLVWSGLTTDERERAWYLGYSSVWRIATEICCVKNNPNKKYKTYIISWFVCFQPLCLFNLVVFLQDFDWL